MPILLPKVLFLSAFGSTITISSVKSTPSISFLRHKWHGNRIELCSKKYSLKTLFQALIYWLSRTCTIFNYFYPNKPHHLRRCRAITSQIGQTNGGLSYKSLRNTFLIYCAKYHIYIFPNMATRRHFGNNNPTDYLHYTENQWFCTVLNF